MLPESSKALPAVEKTSIGQPQPSKKLTPSTAILETTGPVSGSWRRPIVRDVSVRTSPCAARSDYRRCHQPGHKADSPLCPRAPRSARCHSYIQNSAILLLEPLFNSGMRDSTKRHC